MQLKTAFQYIFDDPDWINKTVILFVLSFTTVVLMPILLLGFLPFCVLLGYAIGIINNVRDKRAIILPRWDNYSDFMIRGVGVLVGLMVYSVPYLLIACCTWSIPNLFNNESTGGLALATSLLCIVPLFIGYTLFTWIILATGTIHYARGSSSNIYFQVATLYTKARAAGIISLQWLIYALLITFVFSIIALIPCLGWLIAGAFMIPVQAHLLGQYARKLDTIRH